MKFLTTTLIIILSFALTLFAVKGDKQSVSQNASFLDNYETSPFESSHSSSRYALVKSLIEDKSIFLRSQLAALASPDLSKVNNQYISIFTPGVAFLALPFYYAGSQLGFPQLATFGFISLVSLLNIYLLMRLATAMGAPKHYALFAGLLYAFATNALAYSGTLTQHSLSVGIGLVLTLLAVKDLTLTRALVFGILYGLGIMIDIPNLLLFLPQLTFYFLRFFKIVHDRLRYPSHLSINPKLALLLVGVLVPLFIFGGYNYIATGSPFKLGQRLGRAIYPPDTTSNQLHITPSLPSVTKEKFKQFDTERQIRGYYTLIFSDTRGIFYYFPILTLGIFGVISIWKSKRNLPVHSLALTTIALNLIIYATFNDPWGGWAFGPRYLLPTASFLAIFVSLFLSNLKSQILSLILMLCLTIPSAYISAAGALTTTVVPPDVYTESLVERVPDDYQYNLNLIKVGKSSSLPYNLWLSPYLSLEQLHYFLTFMITLTILLPLFLMQKERHGK